VGRRVIEKIYIGKVEMLKLEGNLNFQKIIFNTILVMRFPLFLTVTI
jgi:hypothetical protein